MIYQIHQMDAEKRGIAIGEKRGIAIGEERGEKRENSAPGMLHEGLSADLISRVTGTLHRWEINKLKAAPNAN